MGKQKMRNLAKLSIIIPARNEEKVIMKTLSSLKRKVDIAHEIIVIDDCSTDHTQAVVSSYIKDNPNVNLVKTTNRKKGFSQAIRKGIGQAKTNIIVIVMADLCDDPKTINKMYKLINQGWDIVCGSRYIKGGDKQGGPKLQGFLSSFVCISLYYLIGIPTHDVSNAFKMYQKGVFTNLKFNPNSGLEISMDLTLQAFFKGYKMTEIPTKWKGRTVGYSKFKLFERSPEYIKIYLQALLTSLGRLL